MKTIEKAEPIDQPGTKDNQGQKGRETPETPANPQYRDWGKGIFLALILIIPLAAFISLVVLTVTVDRNPDHSIVQVIKETRGSIITTTTVYMTPTASLGAADPALGKMSGFFIGPIIFLIVAILETALLLIYGAFYVNAEQYKSYALGLPQGAVRVFVLIIVVLTILTFAFLPAQWGDNKAVVFLFGLLSTVVGFYFGSRSDAGSKDVKNDSSGDKENKDKDAKTESTGETASKDAKKDPSQPPPPKDGTAKSSATTTPTPTAPAAPAPPTRPAPSTPPAAPATPAEPPAAPAEVVQPAEPATPVDPPTTSTGEVQPEPDVPPGPTTGNTP
jgi:hypothetical protein